MGWPDRHRAAISLSFDDARLSQLHRGLPLLERLDVAATFFVLPDAVERNLSHWREAVGRGHEIGNHTVTHPCSANMVWTRQNGLEGMTVAGFRREVREANRRLWHLLHVAPTVFAYPCGDTYVGRGRSTQSLVPMIARSFDVGRTFNDLTANSPGDVDLAQTRCVNSDQRTFEDLLPMLEAALDDSAWLVLGGHEIGTADAGGVDATRSETIEAVVSWCRENRVWIDTIGNTARLIASVKREPVVPARWRHRWASRAGSARHARRGGG